MLANLDYVAKIRNITYYGVDEMIVSERKEFLALYEVQKDVALIKNASRKRTVRTT